MAYPPTPEPGKIMLLSRDEDGAVSHVSMSRELFESLGSEAGLQPAIFTALLDESKDKLRRLKSA